MVPGVNGYANELASVQLSAVGTLWDTGDSGADGMQSGLFQLIGAAGDADTTALAANDIISLCLDYL